MVQKVINGVEIDFCTYGCQGIWFDDDELKKMRNSPDRNTDFEQVEGNFVPKEKTEAISEHLKICPRCNTELYRYNWDMTSNIFLDACDKCNGMWFDNGELKGMNEYLEKMAATEPPNEEEIKLKMAEIENSTSAKLKKDREDNLNKVVDWDLWVFDDAIRFMIDKFTP